MPVGIVEHERQNHPNYFEDDTPPPPPPEPDPPPKPKKKAKKKGSPRKGAK